jgi:hypothetical protein
MSCVYAHIKAVSTPILATLVFFEQLPAADFPILHPVKVVSLRDLHHAETLRFVADLPPRLANPFFASPLERRKLTKREGSLPQLNLPSTFLSSDNRQSPS